MLCIIFCAPEALAQSLQDDVQFLCDSLRTGRRYGTRGVVDAAFWVQHEFESMGLKTDVQHYRSSGKTGHNVRGLLRSPGSGKYIIVMACMDGVGTYDDMVYPGADANASGLAALVALARSMTAQACGSGKWLKNGKPSRNVLFVALDGHNDHSSGAAALWDSLSGLGISRSDILMVVNLAIGCITPPVGLDLFVVSSITKISIDQITVKVMPYLLTLLGTLVVLTYFPGLITFLPGLMH